MPCLYGREFTRAELARATGSLEQVCGVRLVELADGQERGVRMLEFRTGSGLAFEVLVDRCMDVGMLHFHGLPIGWQSPMGYRSPALHEHDGENGLGWLRSFTGVMNTCGLDHIMGPAEEDADHYRYPYRSRIKHGLHGRAALTPARLAGYGTRWEGDRGWLWAEGEVRQATMFGENLHLVRRIEAEIGTDTVTIHDTVTSYGFQPTPHAMLYHVNLGWPVVAEGTRLVAPITDTPFATFDRGKAAIGPLEQAGPQVNFVEQVYEHTMAAGADFMTPVALVNDGFVSPGGAKGLGFLLEYDSRTLPAFYQWQNLQEGHYVVGIEPGSAHAGTRDERKERGQIVMLGHGESRSYSLRMTPFTSADAIAGVEKRVSALV